MWLETEQGARVALTLVYNIFSHTSATTILSTEPAQTEAHSARAGALEWRVAESTENKDRAIANEQQPLSIANRG